MAKRDPRTKEEIVNRILSLDFTGNLKDVFKDPELVKLQRLQPHIVRLVTSSGEKFDLTIHKRRTEESNKKLRAARAAKKAGKRQDGASHQTPPPQKNRGRPPAHARN